MLSVGATMSNDCSTMFNEGTTLLNDGATMYLPLRGTVLFSSYKLK